MKTMVYVAGAVLASMIFLTALAGLHDAARRAIYGDEVLNQEDIDARRRIDYQNALFHQQAADEAALDAANQQAEADKARRQMNDEGTH